MKNQKTKTLVLAALFLALGVVFPQLFHAIGAGPVFLPMHIPVLLCGLICGWQYGGICGLIVPLLSSLLAGMPPLWPTCPSMMLELCAYGLLTGLLHCIRRIFLGLCNCFICVTLCNPGVHFCSLLFLKDFIILLFCENYMGARRIRIPSLDFLIPSQGSYFHKFADGNPPPHRSRI